MKKVLCIGDKYLAGEPIISNNAIAGKLGSCGPYEDTIMFQYELFTKENAPCHPVKVALIPDCAYARIFVVMPTGEVIFHDGKDFDPKRGY